MPTPPDFSTGAVLTAAQMNAVGLWRITSGITATNGTVSDGVVTVNAGVTSVTVTGCFSADFINYRITYSGFTGSSAGAAIAMTLRTSGGADNAANWRGNTYYVAAGNGAGLTNAVTNNSAYCECGGLETEPTNAIFDVLGPFASTRTKTAFTDCTDSYWRTGAFVLVNNTSYTGIKILPIAGTLSGGTIRVYGYRN